MDNGVRRRLHDPSPHWLPNVHMPSAFPVKDAQESSPFDGGYFADNGDGTYTNLVHKCFVPTGYGYRDLYAMGLMAPEEAPDFFLLDNMRVVRRVDGHDIVAEALDGSLKIRQVLYPTLFRDPEQIRIFKAQCDYPGALFSLDFHGGRHAAFTFLRNLRIARNAVSLGGVETLACHPKTTTHSGMSPRELEEAGIGNGLVRVSASIEDWRDLLADFEQALDTIG